MSIPEDLEPLFHRVSDAVASGGPAMGRRRFLTAMLAGAGVAATLPLISRLEAFAAPAIGAHDGILLHVTLAGGNDALNTLAPVEDPLYRSLRPTLAHSLDPSVAPRLPGANSLVLHPALVKLRDRYGRGDVAFVRGVGMKPANFSHFQSMATWMQGWSGSPGPTGWLGRYLDGLPNAAQEPLYGVTLDSSVGLHLNGAKTRATAIHQKLGGFGTSSDSFEQRKVAAVRSMMTQSYSGLAAQYAHAARTMLDLPGTLSAPNGNAALDVYRGDLPESGVERRMALCARLVNADLGIRVLNVTHGSYDTHDYQANEHAARLSELDNAIEAFFTHLEPKFASRVIIMIHSEFSRRPRENDSRGTDHGAAGLVMVIGAPVRGGIYGDQVRLDQLENDNLKFAIDYRSVYATILEDWLTTPSRPILNAQFDKLPILTPPGGGPGLVTTTPTTTTPTTPAPAASVPSMQPPPASGPRAGSSAANKWSSKRSWVGNRRKVGQPRR